MINLIQRFVIDYCDRVFKLQDELYIAKDSYDTRKMYRSCYKNFYTVIRIDLRIIEHCVLKTWII